jgi:hypothetical protein
MTVAMQRHGLPNAPLCRHVVLEAHANSGMVAL